MSDATLPFFPYWHVFVDANGRSHQERRILNGFQQESMGGAAPQWNLHLPTAPDRVLISVLPTDWLGDWHENPAPQWIVPISGSWFVETMDGHRVEMGPGEISYGADQGCIADGQGRKGHRSGTVGREPVVLMLVQMEDGHG